MGSTTHSTDSPPSEHAPPEKGAFADNDASTSDLQVSPETDRLISRKLDRHILPWLFGIWLCAFIDRTNIGNAKILGLEKDLEILDDLKFNIALAVFYILYVLVDVPANWVMKHVGAGYFLPALIISWGLVTTFGGLVKTFASLIVVRLLLGLCEGGLFGGMILYLSMFYRRHQLQLRVALWYCAAPLSGAVGGLLAAGLSRIEHGGYNKWPWIFIIEGAITVVFGLFTLGFLPHTPARAKFLTEDERTTAIKRLELDSNGGNATSTVDTEKFSWRWVRMAILNINSFLCCFNFFTILVPIYSFSLFLPQIILNLGYKDVIAQLFTVPPNVGGFFSVLICSWLSDKYKVRGPFILGGCICAAIGYIMLIAAESPSVRYGGTFFVAAGVFPMSPTVCAWLNNNLAPHYARATGTGLQVGIGNCAAFIATFTYMNKDAPKFIVGHSINLGMLGLTLILTTVTMLYCRMENSKRAKGLRDDRLSEGDPALLGYRHPKFRYTL